MRKVVFSGKGILSSAGDSLEAHLDALYSPLERKSSEDYKIKVKPAPYLSDRRMLKAVSKVDAYGLIAIESLKKDSGYQAEDFNPWRVGLYVGAPPASPWDNENYFDAMRETRDDQGRCQEREFGTTCMNSRPTTLLLGLPNNVLCYGAMIMDARGPNSNYTSGETSGHISVMTAARRIAHGRMEAGVAGAFTAHTEPLNSSMLAHLGYTKRANGIDPYMIHLNGTQGGIDTASSDGSIPQQGSVLADAAAFLLLEDEEHATARGAKPFAEFIAGSLATEEGDQAGYISPRRDPDMGNRSQQALELAISKVLDSSGLAPQDLGLILTAGSGVREQDTAEVTVIKEVFYDHGYTPAVGTTSRALGNFMEARGVVEVALAQKLFAKEALPPIMNVDDRFSSMLDKEKPYALIISGSFFGEWSCLLIKVSTSACGKTPPW